MSQGNSLNGYSYQSFGSTDRMGRRSPASGPTPKSTEGAPALRGANKNMSTLERSSKSKSGKYKPQETAFGEGSSKYLV